MGDTMRFELSRNLNHMVSAINMSSLAMHAENVTSAKSFVDEARKQCMLALNGFEMVLENLGAGPMPKTKLRGQELLDELKDVSNA